MTPAAPRTRLFPIMRRDAAGRPIAGAIRWEVAELFRARAESNHGQTLERLAERGGLDAIEAAIALADSPLFGGINPDDRMAMGMLAGAAHALARLKER